MQHFAHRVLLTFGAGSVLVGLAACSLTSLAGLTSDSDPDAGSASTTGDVTSSGSGSSSGGGGGSSSSGGGSAGDGGSLFSDGGQSDPNVDGDAAEDTGEEASPDAHAAADAGIKDAGSGSSHDAAPSTFCASLSPTPLFCDDFDEGALAAPWDQLSNTNGSEQQSAASYVSAPYAMLVTVNPNTPVTAIDVAGYKSLTAKQGVTGTPTLTFDIRVDVGDESSASDAILGAIQLWNGTAYWDLELEVFYASSSGDFTISMSEDGTSYVQHFVAPHLALATWTRVTLGVALPAGTGGATTATMAINGTTVASDTVHVSTSDPIPEALIGTTYATPASSGWSVAYDNVTFDEP